MYNSAQTRHESWQKGGCSLIRSGNYRKPWKRTNETTDGTRSKIKDIRHLEYVHKYGGKELFTQGVLPNRKIA